MLGKRPVNYKRVVETSSVSQPALLHTNEVVLPVDIAKRLYSFVSRPGQVMDLELKRKLAKLFTFSPL